MPHARNAGMLNSSLDMEIISRLFPHERKTTNNHNTITVNHLAEPIGLFCSSAIDFSLCIIKTKLLLTHNASTSFVTYKLFIISMSYTQWLNWNFSLDSMHVLITCMCRVSCMMYLCSYTAYMTDERTWKMKGSRDNIGEPLTYSMMCRRIIN